MFVRWRMDFKLSYIPYLPSLNASPLQNISISMSFKSFCCIFCSPEFRNGIILYQTKSFVHERCSSNILSFPLVALGNRYQFCTSVAQLPTTHAIHYRLYPQLAITRVVHCRHWPKLATTHVVHYQHCAHLFPWNYSLF